MMQDMENQYQLLMDDIQRLMDKSFLAGFALGAGFISLLWWIL